MYSRYAKDSDANAKANQLTLSSKLQNTVKNFVYNSSFEEEGYWSGSTPPAYSTEQSYIGAKSTKISVQTAGNNVIIYPTNDWQKVTAAEAGETYTFSAYVFTQGISGGGKVELQILNNDGVVATSDPVTANNSEWTRIEVSYTTLAANEVLSYQVKLTGIGTAYVDCAQFEKTPTASRYNLVQNGDFSIVGTDSTRALGWKYNDSIVTTVDRRVTVTDGAAPQLDNYVFKITGDAAEPKRVYQDIPISGQSGDVYTVTGWAKGDSAPLTDDDRQFCLVAQIYYTDGTSTQHLVHFNPDMGSDINWQYGSGHIIAQYGSGDAVRQCQKIRLCLSYRYNVNEVLFDGIQVFKEEFGHSYVYDDDGNVISVTDLRNQTTTYDYEEGTNDLLTATLPTEAKQTYTYDDYHNVTSATSELGVKSTMTYDTYGNNTGVSLVGATKSITSTATYTDDNNLLESVTDVQGNTTTYKYDNILGNMHTGQVSNVIGPTETAWTGTHYGYDEANRLAMIMKNVTLSDFSDELTIYLRYGYRDDQLTSISRRLTTTKYSYYSFEYGDFGLPTVIKAGDNTLISHEYGVTNRDYWLEKSTYGNGDSIAYTYDDIGRTKSITYDGGTTPDIEYEYDANGNLGIMTDKLSNRQSKYLYDHSGRLMRTEIKGINGNNFSYIVEPSYDDINNLTGVTETINGTDYTTSYTYDDDNRVTGTTSGNSSSAFTYDEFSRLSALQRKHDGTNVVGYTYNYWTSGDKTSTQVANVTIKTGSTNFDGYSYNYDKNGNIVMINSNNNTIIYHYDDLNQLVRVDDRNALKTWTYSYDAGGNILKKSEYDYTLDNTLSENSLISSVDYTYSTSDWGDLLEGITDGTTSTIIENDAIGNMKDDGTWEYTWQHGRQLKSMTNGSTTVNFEYDASGMRTKKTVGTKTWEYVYNGSTLSYITDGTNELFFSYDANGPMSVKYNDVDYYYVQNVQGDIIALVNSGGAEVVTYTYDPWGKLLSTDGTMKNTLGQINPLTYRGYVYDRETGLYYLQSRYYNPELCRFICADGLVSTGQDILGYNMFAYCLNNPVNRSDPTGAFSAIDMANMIVGKEPNPEGYEMSELISFAQFELEIIRIIPVEGVTYVQNGDIYEIQSIEFIPYGRIHELDRVDNSWVTALLGILVDGGVEIAGTHIPGFSGVVFIYSGYAILQEAIAYENLTDIIDLAEANNVGLVRINVEWVVVGGQYCGVVSPVYVLWDGEFGQYPDPINPYN